jgi:hypothetical protein
MPAPSVLLDRRFAPPCWDSNVRCFRLSPTVPGPARPHPTPVLRRTGDCGWLYAGGSNPATRRRSASSSSSCHSLSASGHQPPRWRAARAGAATVAEKNLVPTSAKLMVVQVDPVSNRLRWKTSETPDVSRNFRKLSLRIEKSQSRVRLLQRNRFRLGPIGKRHACRATGCCKCAAQQVVANVPRDRLLQMCRATSINQSARKNDFPKSRRASQQVPRCSSALRARRQP